MSVYDFSLRESGLSRLKTTCHGYVVFYGIYRFVTAVKLPGAKAANPPVANGNEQNENFDKALMQVWLKLWSCYGMIRFP